MHAVKLNLKENLSVTAKDNFEGRNSDKQTIDDQLAFLSW